VKKFVAFPLDALPEIVQCGLCVHGARARETHRQRGLWSLHIYHYAGRIIAGRGIFPFDNGWASLLPPGIEATWQFPPYAPHYYVHFRAGQSTGGPCAVEWLQDLGPRRPGFEQAFDGMIACCKQAGTRAHVRLWDLLHNFADGAHDGEKASQLHPTAQIALSILRNHASNPPKIAHIARQLGVSHNHLTRVFQHEFGCGPREFILREKAALAARRLRTTTLAVKLIAAEAGFSDLHHFNKFFHKRLGVSPRRLRKQEQALEPKNVVES
jgi:AraC family transcriptional regulator